jgi:excisionase family DNA binding protein
MERTTRDGIGALVRADNTLNEEQRQRLAKAVDVAERPQRRRLGTVRQAAEILGVCRRTVERYAREGKLTRIRYSKRRVRYDLDEVQAVADNGVEALNNGREF